MDVPGVQYPVSGRSQIGGYLEGHQSAVDEDAKVRFGLIGYIVTDIILAIFFVGSYVFLRGYDNNLRWFPAGEGTPPSHTSFMIMIIAVAGAVAMVLADLLHGASQGLFRLLTLVAFLLFLIDLIYQLQVMSTYPFTPQSGAFATAFLLLAGYHVYHMLIGSFIGLGMTVRAFDGIYDPAKVKARYAAETGHGEHAAEEPPLKISTPVRITTIYFIWAAVYAFAFWLLIIIQPPMVS